MLNNTPIVPMQQESFDRILIKCHDQLSDNNSEKLNKVIDAMFTDTKQLYYAAMQKSLVTSILIPPNVKGLEDELMESQEMNLMFLFLLFFIFFNFIIK